MQCTIVFAFKLKEKIVVFVLGRSPLDEASRNSAQWVKVIMILLIMEIDELSRNGCHLPAVVMQFCI